MVPGVNYFYKHVFDDTINKNKIVTRQNFPYPVYSKDDIYEDYNVSSEDFQ